MLTKMFEHSVKVPRHYKIAANILKKVSTEGGSVKTLLYDDKLRHFRTNVLYALISETIKHAVDIDKIFENCKILENESRLDPWLAKILTAELLFGKKCLPGLSKPVQTVLSYKEQFEKYTSVHQDILKKEDTRRPRYVRINTILLSIADAVVAFENEGYRFISCTTGSYADYLLQIQTLKQEEFTADYHVKTIFVFARGTKFHEHELYLQGKILLQDKATAMAVHLLDPTPGSILLDMCAGPGMKTTQAAAAIRNCGRIYAVERDYERHQSLCQLIRKTQARCVEPIRQDVLEVKSGAMDDVEYILLDPSCSGTGMDFSMAHTYDKARLAKLTALQEKFLRHAMTAFPNAKRIVYSTCSLLPEENEKLVTSVARTLKAKWRVQDVKELLNGEWHNFGPSTSGGISSKCMYARPDSDWTTGFFLAVIERDLRDLQITLKQMEKKRKQKLAMDKAREEKEDREKAERGKQDKVNEEESNTEENQSTEDTGTQEDQTEHREGKEKSKKKKLKIDASEDTIEEDQVDEQPKSKKKKREGKDFSEETTEDIDGTCNNLKRKHNSSLNVITDDLNDLCVLGEVPKKKIKNDKRKEIYDTESNIDLIEDISANATQNDRKESKKKKHSKNNVDDNELFPEEPQTEYERETKKKKRNKHDKDISEMRIDIIEEVTEGPKKKKMKKQWKDDEN